MDQMIWDFPNLYFQLIILTKNGKLGATVKRLVPNVSMGRVPFPNSRIFSWKAKKSTPQSAIKKMETAINPENSQTERKKKRKRKRITSQTD